MTAAETGLRGAAGRYRQARRVCAHLAGSAPQGAVLSGGRVHFGADPADVARSAAGLPADTPLVPFDVRTEITPVQDGAGTLLLHIDRLYYATRSAVAADPRSVESALALPARPSADELAAEEPARPGVSLRRFASYGVVTDPAGNILLSKIAPGFPGAGSWHLPGGGVDHGEEARAALRRELFEETGQHGRVGDLIAIAHHHRGGLIGPENAATEVYAVWVFFHAHVARPCPLEVTEVGGSTIACSWFTPEDLAHIRLSSTARRGLAALVASA
ncbi:MAG: NUDIX domain-containing protein [Nocardiopsaceae bacterium]|nr:NUDIX domain-containing protein [Nocardiopsaceae bacterium]